MEKVNEDEWVWRKKTEGRGREDGLKYPTGEDGKGLKL